MLTKKNTDEMEPDVVVESTEILIWRDKYERLLEHCASLQKTNQLLEERLLSLVDKSENDKMLLSREIDHLAERLANSSSTTEYLHHECARYKSDCMLAVHLLQCQPSVYAQQKLNSMPEDVQRMIAPMLESTSGGHQTPKVQEKKSFTASTPMTFPPTAVFLHNSSPSVDEEAPPEPTSGMKIPEMFVKNILDQADYQTPKVVQCLKCGVATPKFDKTTQTSALDAAANLMEFDEDDVIGPDFRAGIHTKYDVSKYNVSRSTRTLSGDSHTSSETPI